jgi:hypothetical protein
MIRCGNPGGKTMKTVRRFALATVAAAVLSQTPSVIADETQAAPIAPQDVVIPQPEVAPENDEPMLIIPAAKLPLPSGGIMLDAAGVPISNMVNTAAYRQIYKSIPFSRAEYRVNPNYRHDSTMEILTGNARHQTIVQHNHEHKQPEVQVPPPARPSRIFFQPTGLGFLSGSPFGGPFPFPGGPIVPPMLPIAPGP